MIAIPSTISKVETRADRTLKIHVNTQELSSADMADVMTLHGKLGYFVFGETTTLQVPEDPVLDMPTDKSPSKRLKDRMFVYFKKKHDTDKGFQAWYEESLEDIGNKYLAKLD